MKADHIIKHFNLQRHLEGGYFYETYRSLEEIEFVNFNGERAYSTAIYFLLKKSDKSVFHRIKSDETWHFYQGDPLEVLEIDEKGNLIKTKLGTQFDQGEVPQYTVKSGRWFASHSLGDYSFVGCTVAPGFDYRDFELASYENLASIYPDHHDIIKEFSLKN